MLHIPSDGTHQLHPVVASDGECATIQMQDYRHYDNKTPRLGISTQRKSAERFLNPDTLTGTAAQAVAIPVRRPRRTRAIARAHFFHFFCFTLVSLKFPECFRSLSQMFRLFHNKAYKHAGDHPKIYIPLLTSLLYVS